MGDIKSYLLFIYSILICVSNTINQSCTGSQQPVAYATMYNEMKVSPRTWLSRMRIVSEQENVCTVCESSVVSLVTSINYKELF